MFLSFQMTKGESSDELVLGDPSPHDETRKVKRRNRVLQSCIPCHELRRKCDRQRPCTRCSEHGVAGQCVYQLEDPAVRSGPPQDELTRLRRRVAELEHTVRILTQRASPREAGDEKPLIPVSPPRGQGSDEYEELRKHRPRPDDGSGRSPGSSVTSGLYPHRPGGRTDDHGGSIAHCGCATSTAGREVLGQLQTNLAGSIQRLKAMPEHQKHGVNCPLYSQVMNLHDYLRQSSGSLPTSSLQMTFASQSSQPNYGLHSPYAANTSSTHSSASPPQNPNDYMMGSMAGSVPTFDLGSPVEPSQPYSYPASHSSTLSHPFSHSSLSGTSHYSHAQMPSLASVGGSYQHYSQQTSAQSGQYASRPVATATQRPGSSSTVPISDYTSLSTWNAIPESGTPPTSRSRPSRASSGQRGAK